MTANYHSSKIQKLSLRLQPFVIGLLCIAFFGVGFLVRSLTDPGEPPKHISNTKTPEEVQSEADFGIFWETWKELENAYPFDDEEPSIQSRIYKATAGMVESFGDSHTSFFDPEETELLAQDAKGDFGGIGMEIGMREDVPTVIAPLKDSPADKAGIISGDVVYKVDGEDVLNESLDYIIQKIRGEVGTSVTITFLRKGDDNSFEKTIIRKRIETPVINTETRDDVFIIYFYSFNTHATDAFRKALEDFKISGKKKLIIDLRSNPGGFLESAIEITSMFLPRDTVILREKSGGTDEHVYRSFGYDLVDESISIVILIDEGSASASEILAGALSEYGRAKLVGTKTFGKGSVQEFLPLSDGSALKVTVSRWYTPKGKSINETGLVPDFMSSLTRKDIEDGNDPQLDIALKLLAE